MDNYRSSAKTTMICYDYDAEKNCGPSGSQPELNYPPEAVFQIVQLASA